MKWQPLTYFIWQKIILDGNKRVGTRAALLFLYLNGVKLEADPDELADFVLSVVENDVSKKEIADYFRCRSQN